MNYLYHQFSSPISVIIFLPRFPSPPSCVNLGQVLFYFSEYQQVLPLHNAMKNPEDFGGWNGVLNKGMTVVVVAYVTIGFFGYLKYGENVKGSVTLNLEANM